MQSGRYQSKFVNILIKTQSVDLRTPMARSAGTKSNHPLSESFTEIRTAEWTLTEDNFQRGEMILEFQQRFPRRVSWSITARNVCNAGYEICQTYASPPWHARASEQCYEVRQRGISLCYYMPRTTSFLQRAMVTMFATRKVMILKSIWAVNYRTS